MKNLWWNSYVGIPFAEHGRTREGCDCWGLAMLITSEVFGNTLPDLQYQSVGDLEENHKLYLAAGSLLPGWSEIKKPIKMQSGDIVVLKVQAGLPVHVGIVTEPGWFIHCWRGGNATCERMDSPWWRSRIDSFWRCRS